MAAAAGGSGGGGAGTGTLVSLLPDEYTLPFSDIEWEKDEDGEKVELGRGTSGTVYAGWLHGQAVAIKQEAIDNADHVAAWTKTVVLHMRARCPHIVAMVGTVVRTPKAGRTASHYRYAVMERLAGTLEELLLTPDGPHHSADMALRLRLLANVAGGLAYLHSFHIIHADVKPENVLLTATSPPAAKLADFGSSVLRREGTKTRDTLLGERGSLVYMDPRLFDAAASITAASDVYSFGIMAWQVLTGHLPDAEEFAATSATFHQMSDALRRFVLDGRRPAVAALVERGVPPAVVALVEACWAPAQADRPPMVEVQRVLEAAAGSAAPAAEAGALPVPLSEHASPAASLDAALAAAAPVAAAPPPLPVYRYAWDDKLELSGHKNLVCSLALLVGSRLASGDEGGAVRLWDAVRGGEATAVLEGHGGEVYALAALPGGRHLAAGVYAEHGTVGAIVVWDTGVVPPARCATVDCGSGVCALAVLHDGCLAAGCKDGSVRVVELGAGAGAVAVTLERHTAGVAALAVLPDGILASGSGDRTVRLWDADAQVCIATLAGHKGSVNALTVLTDGWLASGSTDYSVWLWDVTTFACVAVLEGHTNWVCAMAALPGGALVSGSADKTIRVWDTRAAVAAGAAAASAGAPGSAARAPPARAKPVAVLKGHADTVLALQPLSGGSGRRLASGSGDGTVRLWRLPSLSMVDR